MTAQEIILKPIMTEKSYAGFPNKVYTFEVNMKANKVEIKKAVEELFEVQVARVNTMIVKGTTKVRRTKNGRVTGRTSDYKKAIVFLKPESKAIAFFESLN
ncbi:MAG TPA: 50S ribosomal protein L23 [Candidatus Onthoplasma faecipullorum]|nr:50S ribosomal protein L23 [Candidatus Onthoplasma faecipullorum]